MKIQQKNIIIIFACVLIAVLGFFGLTFVTENSSPKNTNIISENNAGEVNLKENIQDAQMQKQEVVKPSENYFNYKVKSGEVSYTIKKTYFPARVVMVTGVTNTVMGEGYLSKDYNDYYGAFDVDFSTLKTDSSKRDSDILGIFTPKIITLVLKTESNEKLKVTDGKIDQKVNGILGINGIEKTLPISIKGTVSETEVNFEGSFTVILSEFNIKTPGVPKIFEVEDKAEVKFKVVGVVE
ncbi:YceI family protein [Patescibacteria group bacterium]|nr:YceI family protein [Patescibacteria group bacterium]